MIYIWSCCFYILFLALVKLSIRPIAKKDKAKGVAENKKEI